MIRTDDISGNRIRRPCAEVQRLGVDEGGAQQAQFSQQQKSRHVLEPTASDVFSHIVCVDKLREITVVKHWQISCLFI